MGTLAQVMPKELCIMHSNWNVFQFRRFAFCILGEIIQFCCYVFKTQTTSYFASKLFPNTTGAQYVSCFYIALSGTALPLSAIYKLDTFWTCVNTRYFSTLNAYIRFCSWLLNNNFRRLTSTLISSSAFWSSEVQTVFVTAADLKFSPGVISRRQNLHKKKWRHKNELKVKRN